jgi:cytochrome c-type biogenesis protein CcmH
MALAAQLRCVVCQNQTVAESRAPMAEDMRREIRSSSSRAIAMPGDRLLRAALRCFVRYNPPWKPSTWLLWSSPFLAALGGFVLLRAHCAAGSCRMSR